MKDYRDFLNTLDDEKLLILKNDIENHPMFLSAPTDIDRNFLQAFLVNSMMLHMYHEWLNKENE